jgi:putative transposase
MLIKRAFKFKLKPSKSDRDLLIRFAGARRFVYNRGLNQRQKIYEATGKSPTYYDQNNELPILKKEPETSWIKEIHSQILQQALKDLESAFNHFFRSGYPKFKKKGIHETFRYPQGVKVKEAKAFLPKIGWVRFRKSREIQGIIKETTLTQEGKEWFISFSCEWEKKTLQPAPIHENNSLGIDMGLKHFAVTASGEKNQQHVIENPRYLKKHLSHLRFLSKQLSKKAKRGQNRLKARRRLSKLHAKIKNLRSDFVQKLSTEMIKTHDIFCIESLDILGLLQKSPKGLSRSIADVGWRSFLHCLKYKAEEKGKHIVEAGRYFASSQICSICGNRQEMPLEKREYHCQNCGQKIDRDYNSAIVLKAAGMSVLKACGAALNGGSLEAGISRL